jgi:ATP-dependent metalloprotease
MGALRLTARAANTLTPKSHLNFHTFSSIRCVTPAVLRTPIAHPRLSHVYRFPKPLQPCTRRNLSLSTLLNRAEPAKTPSPSVVANIVRIEAEANAAPHDISKQLVLFEALAATKAKAGYDLILTRWERMCEFVSYSCN